MFQYDISDKRDFASKVDRVQAYHNFLVTINMHRVDFPFSYEKGINSKGKPRVYTVVSFGGYMSSGNEWIVFISYRSLWPDNTVVHRWFWSEDDNDVHDHSIQNWVN